MSKTKLTLFSVQCQGESYSILAHLPVCLDGKVRVSANERAALIRRVQEAHNVDFFSGHCIRIRIGG